MSSILVYTALLILVCTYVLFPVLLWARGSLRRRPHLKAAVTPRVSLIIAAHNEARSITRKLDNTLTLDYPRLDVVVASDGSDDDTDALVSGYASKGIRLLSLPRVGKAQALNRAVAASDSEIIVFSDANSMYATDAIRMLVRSFADPAVGAVAGNQVYTDEPTGVSISQGELAYWRLDRLLKIVDTWTASAISATGAIYAIRRRLFHKVPSGVSDDFFISTSVIAQGYRLVFEPEAIAFEPVAHATRRQFSRRVRVITLGLYGVIAMRRLLNPRRYGFYAIELFWHKILRRLMFVPLLILLLVSPFLWAEGVLFRLLNILQMGFYGCAIVGTISQGSRLGQIRLFSIPMFFCLVNTAALVATVNVLRGRRIELWSPQRGNTSDSPG